MMKKIIKHAAMTGLVSIAMATGAFAGGTATGVEPGGGCKAALGGTFTKVTGSPYQGTAGLTYDASTDEVKFSVKATKFGGTDELVASGKQSNISGSDAFLSLKGSDLRGFCLSNIEVGPTGYAEVLAASRLEYVTDTVATVNAIIVPLVVQ